MPAPTMAILSGWSEILLVVDSADVAALQGTLLATSASFLERKKELHERGMRFMHATGIAQS
jgi:hypothetical protein